MEGVFGRPPTLNPRDSHWSVAFDLRPGCVTAQYKTRNRLEIRVQLELNREGPGFPNARRTVG